MLVFITLIEIQIIITFITFVMAMFSYIFSENGDPAESKLFFLNIASICSISCIMTILTAFICFYLKNKYFKYK